MVKQNLTLQYLVYLTYLAELFPFILFLIFFKKIKSTDIRVFFLYTFVLALSICISIYLKFYLKDGSSRLILNRIFLVLEFIFLSIFYNYSITNKYKMWIFFPSTIIFIILSIQDYLVSFSSNFSFIPLVIECLFFLLVIVYFFYEKIQHSISTPIYTSPVFWISVGFLIYFSGNFFLFLFSNSMYKDENFKTQYTLIYSIVTIFKNIFLCTAVITNKDLVNQQQMEAKPIDIDLGTFNPYNKNL